MAKRKDYVIFRIVAFTLISKCMKVTFLSVFKKSMRKSKKKAEEVLVPALNKADEISHSPEEEFQSASAMLADDNKEAVKHLKKTLAEVSVHLWRIKKRMLDESGEPLEELRRHFRHVQAALDDLTNSEIEIKDFDHQRIPESGVLSLRVLAYQPTAGISSEQIIETVKPAIYYKGETIQYGEVIVGIPENE